MTIKIWSSAHSIFFFFFFGGTTARGGPWPPLQYASKPLDPLLYLFIRLFPSFSGPWTHHTALSFLVFLSAHSIVFSNFLLFHCMPFFITPFNSCIILLMYTLNNTGERSHPCLTPLIMCIGSDIPPLNLITTFVKIVSVKIISSGFQDISLNKPIFQ